MRKDTQLKQQALMLKAAFEEGRAAGLAWESVDPETDWDNSTAKQMHDQLLMEAQGGNNVRT